MKPAPFDYERPDSLDRAIAALASAAGEARLLAGGQTLGPLLNLRLVKPALLVDIGHIAALKRLEERADRLVIGAGVTHAMLEDRLDPSPLGRPLSHVASTIAYRAIRNRGTIGGSLSHADPAADWVSAMMLLDAEVVIAGASRKRRVAMREFMRGAFATAIEPFEVLEAVEVPKLTQEARWGYYRICRKAGEFPDAIGAVLLDPSRAVSRIVAGALDGPPVLLPELAERVAREGGAAATIERVSEAVRSAASELDDTALLLHAAAVRRATIQAVGS